jgi:hypothetical protein
MSFRMPCPLRLLLCLNLIIGLAPCAPASARTQHLRPVTNVTASEQKALLLLDELLNHTKDFGGGFNSPMKVILFQTKAASLLWDYDQPRARFLFEAAMKSASSLTPNVEGVTIPFGSDNHVLVKQTILNSALPRDPAFAERLAALALASYPQRRVPDTAMYWLYLREQTALYSQVAKHIAASDPQRAAQLLRVSFNGSYSHSQVEALNALRRNAPARADEIFLHALTLVKARPTGLSNKVGLLAPYLFPEIVNEVGSALRRSGDAGEAGQVNDVLAKPFLEFVYGSFLQQPIAAQTAENNEFGSASFDSLTMQGLAVHFERHLPEKAAAYRARIKEVIATIEKEGRKDLFDREREAYDEFFRRDVQDLLNRAAAAETQDQRDRYYSDAAGLLAYKDEDYDQALDLLDRVSDSQEKNYLLLTYRHLRIRKAVRDGDAEKAYSHIRSLPDVDKGSAYFRSAKPTFLIDAARLYVNKGEGERAKALLEEAKQGLIGLQSDSEMASLMVSIASVAVEISPEFGFQTMKEAVGTLNARSNPRASAESMGVGEGGKILFFEGYHLEDIFAPLGRADFDRALQLARSLKSKEAALMAQFGICKGVLAKSGAAPSTKSK